mmetsp:Transcript_2967/g.4414  ORF Transcript_2967/g.4414 Transcript_2967/m.4414 type:complete len:196 (+) Transcript_2967:253-840(+)
MSTPQSMTPDADVSVSASAGKENGDAATNSSSGGDSPAPAATSTSRSEPVPFVYDPDKTSLKFIFANRDGLHVILDCKPADTIGEVKGALLSMWPEEMPACSGGDKIRLICMGKGMLSPDTKTLEGCDIPVFKTHPTPVNVAVRPEAGVMGGGTKKNSSKKGSMATDGGGGANGARTGSGGTPESGSSGCSCAIM